MMHFSNWLSQLGSVTKFSLLTLPERKGAAAASIFGTAGVVAVMVGVLSIGQGFRHAMINSGDPQAVIVMRSGADTEMMSILSREETRTIMDAPGVARSAQGPMASPELFVIINLPKRSTGTDANVPLRGIEHAAREVRKEVRLISGRWFQTGRNEVVVGRGAAAEFTGLDLGGTLIVAQNIWKIVGIFSSSGGIDESEIWTDASILQAAYRRGTSYQSVYLRLTSPEAFTEFKNALSEDPRTNVKVLRQTDYYSEQSRMIYNLITGVGSLIAGLMGVGAVFGALNTMYSAVAARTREIATLRALGFGRSAVVVSILFESLVLALVGGCIGGGLAYLAFDGYQAATINWQSFSQVAFAFKVTPLLLAQGILYSSAIGCIGGLFPAIRAARLPIAKALREL